MFEKTESGQYGNLAVVYTKVCESKGSASEEGVDVQSALSLAPFG